MTKLTQMVNIGKEMERKLQAVGVDSKEELIRIGSKEAYIRLKTLFPNVCAVHLYLLEGAINNLKYNMLPEKTTKELKAFADMFK